VSHVSTFSLMLAALALCATARADDSHPRPADDGSPADSAPSDHADAPRHFDYSRYSNGPRRVPRPRGASEVRARALGLGTEPVGHRLLIAPPEERWVRAAGGDQAPDHLTWPVENGRFGRGFGFVRHTRPDLRHDGVDIVAEEGSVVRAAADGIVAYSDNGIHGYGNCVILIHPGGWVTLYAHTFRTTVQPGWRVHAGERIAFVGSTGISHGPHVHFELHIHGRPVDPLHRFEGRPWIDAYRAMVARRERGEDFHPTAYLTVGRDHQRPPRDGEPSQERADEMAAARAHVDSPPATAEEQEAADSAVAAQEDEEEATRDDETGSPESAPAGVSERQLRALLRHGADDSELEGVAGRQFRSVLWPARGGQLVQARRERLRIEGEPATPARATADGRVIFVGERRGSRGITMAILHPNGWISLYEGLDEAALAAGDDVLRGAWLGHFGSRALSFELYQSGHRLDPSPLLVGAPTGS